MKTLALIFILIALPISADEPSVPVKSIVASSMQMFKVPSDFIVRAADKMPEESYSFRATADVRTFGEILGHIADGYRLVCGIAAGDAMPKDIREIEKTKKTKAELVAALRENAAYCEEVHRRLDGVAGAEVVDFFGKPYARASLLFFNTSHAWEHYGNLVTYMRLKDVLPPSSEPKKKESK